jgi:RNA polymerase sigma-70 factor (ECF subfamily)
MEPPDLELLARIAAGEQEAMHHFYERYYPRLRHFLRGRLHGDSALVEDALQEIFLNIWRSAGSFRNQSSVATWVFQIAYHQALRSLRRQDASAKRRQATTDEHVDLSRDTVSHTVSLEDVVVDRITLANALRQLSDKHRDVLEMVFYYGFAPDEVANILAVAPGTVKSRISYARRALLQLLNETSVREMQP